MRWGVILLGFLWAQKTSQKAPYRHSCTYPLPPTRVAQPESVKKPYTRGMERLSVPGISPVGPYSPAVRVGPWVFLSGQIALKPDGSVEKSSLEKEIQQVLDNVQAVLHAAGAKPEHLVKVTIFLTDMAFFSTVNTYYERLFPPGAYPARETVAVAALPRGARIEISGIAYVGE